MQAAQAAKFSKDEIQNLINVMNGKADVSSLSDEMQRLVEAERKLDDAKWARDKIDAAKTEVEKYRDEVEAESCRGCRQLFARANGQNPEGRLAR